MPQHPKAQLFATLRDYFGEITGEHEKAAAARTKQGADTPDGIADPGGYEGKSTHPSAERSVAEHLRPEQTGARFSENTQDVKEDIGSGSIENLPEEATSPSKGSGNQDKRQPNIGVRNAATGEDTAVERKFKGTKDDPGTTSVMKADDGEKYGSWSMQKLAQFLGETGEAILADIANGKFAVKAGGIGDDVSNGTRKVPNGQPARPRQDSQQSGQEPASDEVKEAAQRGYELAAVLGLQDMSPEERAAQMIETIIKEASYQADLTAEFIAGYGQVLQKAAAGEPVEGVEGEDHSMPGDAASGANPSGAMGGGAGAGGDAGGGEGAGVLSQIPPEVLQQLIAALQQGQMGGGMGGAGGQDIGAGDAAAAMGADGGGGGPDPSGAAGPSGEGQAAEGFSPDQVNDQLAGGMQDMQLSPEQLEAMAPKVAADKRPLILKIASRVRQHVRSGRYDSTKRANTPAERQLRDEVKSYLAEVVGAV
jgi:hypothetical protein